MSLKLQCKWVPHQGPNKYKMGSRLNNKFLVYVGDSSNNVDTQNISFENLGRFTALGLIQPFSKTT